MYQNEGPGEEEGVRRAPTSCSRRCRPSTVFAKRLNYRTRNAFRTPSRRQFLAVSTLSLVGGAGCLGDSAFVGAPNDDSRDRDGDHEDGGDEDERDDSSVDGDEVLFTVSDGDEEVELSTCGDAATVGEVETQKRLDGYFVPITLTDDGADAFADGLDAIGAFDGPTAYEIRTHLDGEVIYAATLGPDLAAAIEEGDWDGEMLVQSDDRETAEEMRAALDGA